MRFQPVTLDNGTADSEALLLFRDDRLLAIVTRLSAMHGELEGRWFVEMNFRRPGEVSGRTFAELVEVESWAEGLSAGPP